MNSLPGNTCITLEKAQKSAFSYVGDVSGFCPSSGGNLSQYPSCARPFIRGKEI